MNWSNQNHTDRMTVVGKNVLTSTTTTPPCVRKDLTLLSASNLNSLLAFCTSWKRLELCTLRSFISRSRVVLLRAARLVCLWKIRSKHLNHWTVDAVCTSHLSLSRDSISSLHSLRCKLLMTSGQPGFTLCATEEINRSTQGPSIVKQVVQQQCGWLWCCFGRHCVDRGVGGGGGGGNYY